MLWSKRRRTGERGHPVSVVLYTKRECPLCVAMKEELALARPSARFELVETDVESDPELLARHALSVPVLEIEGQVVFRGRLTAREFERALDERGAR